MNKGQRIIPFYITQCQDPKDRTTATQQLFHRLPLRMIYHTYLYGIHTGHRYTFALKFISGLAIIDDIQIKRRANKNKDSNKKQQ